MAWLQNQTYVKQQNTLMVLDLISQCQLVSRTELSSMTEISPASITRIVGALMELGLVAEGAPTAAAGRGRKAIGVYTRADGLYAAGVCIETGKLCVSIIDFHQLCLGIEEMPLDEDAPYMPEELAAGAAKLLSKLRASLNIDLSRLRVAGVSVQGVVDKDKRVLLLSDQLQLKDVDLCGIFSDTLGLTAWIENDVKACLMGERVKRLLPRHEDMAYLMLGSGVGVAATSDGKLIRGLRNQAGEIEHLSDDTTLMPVNTLVPPLLAREILKQARAMGLDAPNLDALINIWRAGDIKARALLDETRRALRLAIQLINCFYDPRHIILGGPTVHALSDALTDILRDARVSVGEDYEAACMTGAAIIAARQAVEEMLNEPT